MSSPWSRPLAFLFTVLVITVAPTIAVASTGPAIGQAAPDFSLRDVNGKTVRLSDFRGRHVVLEWNNPSCPFVQKHYGSGNMQQLQKEAAARNVAWLTINSTETGHGDYQAPAQLARWMREQGGVPAATLMDADGAAGRAYGARVTPHMYIVDPQGRLIYAGGVDDKPSARASDLVGATNYIRVGLRQALAGQPLSQPTTRAYGCTIKYQ
ncbi:thioredoxin family protein [Hylemonella gracilis]|uniref:Thioredoxin family protein n=1 Tax=Hylemonella gracilis TaxID=80880 RepID=A0A4P6UJ09_9BURK|nr:thioredoxin family protein [Hylemonella gracilis]QBK04067.1 thioredoxin family protein [Hylemonella gracilis]